MVLLMKKSKFIVPILMAFSASTAIAGKTDDSPRLPVKSCMKSQKQEDHLKKSIRIISADGTDLTPEKSDNEKRFSKIPVPNLSEKNLVDRLQTRAALVTLFDVPDFEWEFGISTLRVVLGLSTEIRERHERWAVNSYREVDLLLDALEIFLKQSVKFKEDPLFLIGVAQHRQRIENQMLITHYYKYQASHELFDKYQENSALDMDADQLELHRNFKRLSLQNDALDHLTKRSSTATYSLKKILGQGTLGDLDKRKAIFDHLSECYRKNTSPQVLFRDLSEKDSLILNRFVIAVKERLLCFITPEEEQIIEKYDETFKEIFSPESKDASSTEGDSHSDV